MISNLGDHSTELDLLAAEGVPGSMYIAGTDSVSKVPPNKVYVIFFSNFEFNPFDFSPVIVDVSTRRERGDDNHDQNIDVTGKQQEVCPIRARGIQ